MSAAGGGRVGIGYDAHRFAEGRPLMLGGIEIPGEPGLEGHSDGDAVIHAVIDAILGAAGLGDIGTHFPPTEERWRGAASLDLLTTVMGELRGRVVNVDVTVICEHPRLRPHRAEMERTLATTLSAPVSIKATTNEGMGEIGRGEGLAALAVAMVELD
jgi:2-C-methyl-D-erythritol 2,4-cyclodiphosphate synthase